MRMVRLTPREQFCTQGGYKVGAVVGIGRLQASSGRPTAPHGSAGAPFCVVSSMVGLVCGDGHAVRDADCSSRLHVAHVHVPRFLGSTKLL